jgi:hypothetical protein
MVDASSVLPGEYWLREESARLSAQVANDSPTVTWATSGGSITQDGLFTAPSKLPASGSVTVSATTSKGAKDQRTIAIVEPPPVEPAPESPAEETPPVETPTGTPPGKTTTGSTTPSGSTTGSSTPSAETSSSSQATGSGVLGAQTVKRASRWTARRSSCSGERS